MAQLPLLLLDLRFPITDLMFPVRDCRSMRFTPDFLPSLLDELLQGSNTFPSTTRSLSATPGKRHRIQADSLPQHRAATGPMRLLDRRAMCRRLLRTAP